MPLSVESGITRTCYTDCRKPSWFLEVYSKSEIFVQELFETKSVAHK